jgi:hypothetical protein
MITFADVPKNPPPALTSTPATFPVRILEISVSGLDSRSSASILVIA